MADPKFHQLTRRAIREVRMTRFYSDAAKRASHDARRAYKDVKFYVEEGRADDAARADKRRREALAFFEEMRGEGIKALSRARDLRAEAAKLLGGKK